MIGPVALAASVLSFLAALPAAPVAAPFAADPGERVAVPPAAAIMEVQLWPEYDDPGVLAIYEGRLRPSVDTPVDVTFTVPAGARVHMVGGIDDGGRHLHAEYSTRERGDGLVDISYRLEVPTFYMEFYYDPFSGRDRREFRYPLVSSFPVDSLVVAVQRPLRAQGFHILPPTGEVSRDQNGFEYFVVRLGARTAGERTPITVSYRKEDREPSVSADESRVSAPAPAGDLPPSRHRLEFLVLGIAGVLLGSVGLYPSVRDWLGGRRRADPVAPERGVGRNRRSGRSRNFCTRCGAPLSDGANYCSGCGARRRLPASR